MPTFERSGIEAAKSCFGHHCLREVSLEEGLAEGPRPGVHCGPEPAVVVGFLELDKVVATAERAELDTALALQRLDEQTLLELRSRQTLREDPAARVASRGPFDRARP